MGKASPGLSGGSLMLLPVLLFEKQRGIVIQTQKRENKAEGAHRHPKHTISSQYLEEATGGFCLHILQREMLTGDIWALYSRKRMENTFVCVKSPSVLQFSILCQEFPRSLYTKSSEPERVQSLREVVLGQNWQSRAK